jgi:hypothetical protein
MDDSNAPATKADLAALEASLNEPFDLLRSEMHRMHDDLMNRIAQRETRLLQAFETFTQADRKAIRIR